MDDGKSTDPRIQERSIRMDVTKSKDPVDRAVAAVRTAQDRLVRLLHSEDDAVRRKAVVALQAQDPLPISPVADALFRARDADSRLRLVALLGAMGAFEPIRVLAEFATALKGEKEMGVRRAILNTMVVVAMGSHRACGAQPEGGGPITPPETSREDDSRPAREPGGCGGGT